MSKLLSVMVAGIALVAVSAHAAEPHKATPAARAMPAEPAKHEAGKPMEAPKAMPAEPATAAAPAMKADDQSNKGKHKGADEGKKKGHTKK